MIGFLLADALLRPLLLAILTACVLVIVAVARDILTSHHQDPEN